MAGRMPDINARFLARVADWAAARLMKLIHAIIMMRRATADRA